MTVTWRRVHKGDVRARELADDHYTRQRRGHPMWTRPGYNFVLLAEFAQGAALFCWWRPKWEDGRPGTKRRDGLRVIECTMFRRVGETPVASDLIRAAVDELHGVQSFQDLQLERAGWVAGLVTGVSSRATASRRSRAHRPGHCFRMAGWVDFPKRTSRADVWLRHPFRNPVYDPAADQLSLFEAP